MDRKKIICIGFMFILTVFVSVSYFSYAFFMSKDEYHGKVNIVAGTLNYKLSSSLLDSNNSIILASNEKARLNIEIESLNTINSKYKLYYETTNSDIEIGYSAINELPTGIINAKSKKIVTVIIKNATNTSATIKFGVEGGFIYNEVKLAEGLNSLPQIQSSYCAVPVNTVYIFDYKTPNGGEDSFDISCSGDYKLETWGAQGGTINTNYIGGYGAYAIGNYSLTKGTRLYINVGQEGIGTKTTYLNLPATYNGGGEATGNMSSDSTSPQYHGSGGGATHIAFEKGVLSSLSLHATDNRIIIVAGGGGGALYFYYNPTGGTVAYNGGNGRSILNGISNFGQGTTNASGGGGGYSGGTGGANDTSKGGTSYFNDYITNRYVYCYKCDMEYDDGKTVTVFTHAGSELLDKINCPYGYNSNPISKCAKAGNGYARITFLNESTEEEKTNIDL